MIRGFNPDGIVPEYMLAKINYSRPVRIGWTVDDPLTTDCFVEHGFDCELPGYEVEYCNAIISGVLKMPYELKFYETYDDIGDALTAGEVDIPGLSYFVDKEVADKWGGWAPVYLWDGTALIVHETDKEPDATLLLLQAFKYDLWLAMVGCTLLALLIRWLSKKLFKGRKRNGLPLSPLSRFVYSFRAKIFYVLWFMFLSILLSFYSNVFAVQILTSTKDKVIPITDMDDLARKLVSKECKLAVYSAYLNDSEFHGTIINPDRHNRSWAPLMRDAYLNNKPYYTDTREDMMDHVLKDKCTIGLDWWTMEPYYKTHYCDVRVVMFEEERDTYFQYTYYTTRDDIRDAVYTVISSSSFQSYPDYLAKKYYMKASPKDCGSVNSDNKPPPLSISTLQDSVYVWIIGLGVALIILVYEKIRVSGKGGQPLLGDQSTWNRSTWRRDGTSKRSTVAPNQKSEAGTQMSPGVQRRRPRQHYQIYF